MASLVRSPHEERNMLDKIEQPTRTTWAERQVAGGTLYLRRQSAAHPWEIANFFRELNARTALADGVLYYTGLQDHPSLHQTFATPEEAAQFIRQFVA
jgi:hypothetical protein